MDAQHRNYIHYVAKQERAVRRLEIGDRLQVTAQLGGFMGTVRDAHTDAHDNHHISIDGLDGDDIDLTIDSEGAHMSRYDYFVPYVVAGNSHKSLGEVFELTINGEAVTDCAPDALAD